MLVNYAKDMEKTYFFFQFFNVSMVSQDFDSFIVYENQI